MELRAANTLEAAGARTERVAAARRARVTGHSESSQQLASLGEGSRVGRSELVSGAAVGKGIIQLLFLVIHGVVLWVLVPLGTVAWALGSPWLVGRHVSLGKFLGWLDLNFSASLVRGLLSPGFRGTSLTWVSPREMRSVTHRVGFLDLF